jgi:hypothetical protein
MINLALKVQYLMWHYTTSEAEIALLNNLSISEVHEININITPVGQLLGKQRNYLF